MAVGTFAMLAVLLATTPQVSSIGSAKSEARVAFDRLLNAFALCDQKETARLTSPEWTYIGADGRVYSREDYLKEMRARCKPGPAPVLRDVQMRAYGDHTAIIVAASDASESTKSASGSIRMTVVWIKQNCRWSSVHAQASPIIALSQPAAAPR